MRLHIQEGRRRRPEVRLTDDLPITRRMFGVDLVGSRRIWPAQVGCLVDLVGSRPIQKDRLDDHSDDQGHPTEDRMARRATLVVGYRASA
jgi:hypothetical protein